MSRRRWFMTERGGYRETYSSRGGARFSAWDPSEKERDERFSFSQIGNREGYSRGRGRGIGYLGERGGDYSRGRGRGRSNGRGRGYSPGQRGGWRNYSSSEWHGERSLPGEDRRAVTASPSSAFYSHSLSRPHRNDGALSREEYRNFPVRRAASASGNVRPIGYGKLASVERDKTVTAQAIVILLASSRSGLEELLKEKFDDDMTEILLKVFGKMSESDGPTQSLTRVLQLILEYKFLEKIRSLILATKCASDWAAPVSRGKSRTNTRLQIQNTLKLMKSLMTVLPNDSCNEVAMTKCFLDPMIREVGVVDTKIREYYDEVCANLTTVQEKRQRKAILRTTRRSGLDDLHSHPAPDDFRDIPVFPRLSDINEDIRPFIRTNLINKAYENVDHYLDVQFRLLREDFIRPLREGIAEIKRYNTTAPGDYQRKRFDNVKVYHGVVVQHFQLSRQHGVMYRIQFNAEILRRVRWHNTKRLLHGNLLCLSSDEFKEEVIFAVVVDREPQFLQDGLLTIQFVSDDDQEREQDMEDQNQGAEGAEDMGQLNEEADKVPGVAGVEEDEFANAEHVDDDQRLNGGAVRHQIEKNTTPKIETPTLDMKKTYTMVETDAYFESFRHILAGLKETEAIPMDRYIVHYQENVYPPRYLRTAVTERSVQYDFTAVTNSEEKVEILRENWPTADELGLDPSQRDAVKLALTKELAIIQGPPGTGKTHVGLVIMKLLLRNKDRWSGGNIDRGTRNLNSFPILVVCYTNHALDQFLEGIAKFSGENEKIVRVGGRCKNEQTKKFSLREIKYARRFRPFDIDEDDDDETIRRTIREIEGDLRAIEEELQTNERKLEASLHCIPSLSELERFIPPDLFQQFHRDRVLHMPEGYEYYSHIHKKRSLDDALLRWLGINLTVQPRKVAKDINRVLTTIGHTEENIVKAYHATNSQDATVLHSWITANCGGKTEESKEDLSETLHERDQKTGEMQVEILKDNTSDADLTLLDTELTLLDEEKPSTSQTGRNEEIEEENEILEDPALVDEHRFLDTDEIPGMASMREKKSIRLEMQNLVKRIGAISLEDVEENEEEDPEQAQSEEWQQTRHQKRKMRQKLKVVIRGTATMAEDEEKRVRNIFSLRQEGRERLFRTWIARWRQGFRAGSEKKLETYSRLASQLQELRRQEDAGILRRADVIAVTTTGAAKYRDLIYRLNCKIVVVEEAAEVLEAHIVTAMPRSTEHLILIGDHRQLKPSATVYELARKYNLDTSLFERLIKKVRHVTLCRQHRMRPAIADLIRPHIYKNLQDDDSVLVRSDITGIQKPLFFLSHTVAEECLDDGKSKKNQFEADFVIALCNYILKQGYQPEQITVITMYTGQIFAFRGKGRLPDGVRVTAVDNFQGEENDIILLSLVRSNEEAKIGFLGVKNRICVALSRAKSALYCIGNMELLGSKSDTWDTIVQHLQEKECIGESLMLQCKHHPDRLTPVKCVKDFTKVPEGGCGHPCKARMKCGHVCPKPCHPYEHDFNCLKPCDRIIPCENKHPCKRKCYQSCTPCPERVPKVIPKCGHTQRVPCQMPPKNFRCMVLVEVKLSCGHLICIPCSASEDTKAYMCKEKCRDVLECGHQCRGSCYECFQGRLHVPCSKRCGRVIVCGHSCSAYCSSCPPCRKKCRTKCNHSDCKKICGEPCVLCKEKCQWKCPHYECTKKCSEPCNRPPCNRPCRKQIKQCKHPCIGLCGEPCPKLCRICDKKKVQEIFFGDEGDVKARFVELEDCGHIFTYRSLDRWMNQKEEGNAIKMKECPRCKTTIWRSTRYGTIINQLLNSLNKVKIKIWGFALQEKNHLKNQLKAEKEENEGYGSMFGFKELNWMENETKAHLSAHEVFLLEEKHKRLTALRKLEKRHYELWVMNGSTLSEIRKLLKAIHEDLHHMLNWIFLRRTQSTSQEEQSFRRENERIEDAVKFIDIYSKYEKKKRIGFVLYRDIEKVKGKLEPILMKLKTLLLGSMEPYHDAKKSEVKSLFQDISDLVPEFSSNLGITHQEKEMLCKAMGFATKGHWYSCPKGHVYAIGDCGGATAQSVCPECKEQIGGSSHRLLASNRVATEMDGATRPAYDPTNNYIPRDLLDQMRRDGFG